MPYVTQQRRVELRACPIPKVAGEVNYLLTLALIRAYRSSSFKWLGKATSDLIMRYWNEADKQCYQTINDILGAIDGAKREFKRRTVASDIELHLVEKQLNLALNAFYSKIAGPYEDDAIIRNGDVYDNDGE